MFTFTNFKRIVGTSIMVVKNMKQVVELKDELGKDHYAEHLINTYDKIRCCKASEKRVKRHNLVPVCQWV